MVRIKIVKQPRSHSKKIIEDPIMGQNGSRMSPEAGTSNTTPPADITQPADTLDHLDEYREGWLKFIADVREKKCQSAPPVPSPPSSRKRRRAAAPPAGEQLNIGVDIDENNILEGKRRRKSRRTSPSPAPARRASAPAAIAGQTPAKTPVKKRSPRVREIIYERATQAKHYEDDYEENFDGNFEEDSEDSFKPLMVLAIVCGFEDKATESPSFSMKDPVRYVPEMDQALEEYDRQRAVKRAAGRGRKGKGKRKRHSD